MTFAPDLILQWLLRTGLEATLLVFIVLALRWTLGHHLGPRWRVALWTLVGIKLLIPATLAFLPGVGQVLRIDPPLAVADITDESVVTNATVALPVPTANSSASPSLPTVKKFSWQGLIVSIWLLGAFGFIASTLWRQWRFSSSTSDVHCDDTALNSLLQSTAAEVGLRRPLIAIVCSQSVTPAVFGVFRPRILLPADWKQRFDEVSLRHILLHELEHVRFGDVIWNWVAAFLTALHWFNPLVWIARSAFQADRELRCDADTVARLQSGDRLAYGRTLLSVQLHFHSAPAIAGLAPCVRNHPPLHQRITMITQPTARKNWLNCILVIAIAALFCVSFGSAQTDGERGSEGARDKDTPRREGVRDGDRVAIRPSGEVQLRIDTDGVVLGDTKYRSMAEFRSAFENTDATSVVISTQPQLPVSTLNAVLDVFSDMGIKKVSLQAERADEGGRDEGSPKREGARDGDTPKREGARDGDTPKREGARDGDTPKREGARDGDTPKREGARDGDTPKREGARDGDTPKREGARDGDTPKREGARDGGNSREGARGQSNPEMDRKVQQLTRIFEAYDKNSDRTVTFAEWLAMKDGEMTRDREKREQGWFDEADSNGDDILILEEWKVWKLSQGRH